MLTALGGHDVLLFGASFRLLDIDVRLRSTHKFRRNYLDISYGTKLII